MMCSVCGALIFTFYTKSMQHVQSVSDSEFKRGFRAGDIFFLRIICLDLIMRTMEMVFNCWEDKNMREKQSQKKSQKEEENWATGDYKNAK